MASTASMAYLLPGVPACQPAHLEGDIEFATEILPGPPSVASIQQSLQKRDPKKPLYSYLPASDPGSTYSGVMHGTVIAQESDLAKAKRSRIDKGTAGGRAQRASARQQNGLGGAENPNAVDSVPVLTDTDATMAVDDELRLLSRSSSIVLEGSAAAANGRTKRKDKGKAKEVEPFVRIKEEPKPISLLTPEPVVNQVPNEDHCSSCQTATGALVYCDGCPRAFHLWCLNPPLESAESISSVWYCPACQARKHPPRKPVQSLLSPLIYVLNNSIPTEYQLPEDIRTFFKDVSANAKGAYVDNSDIKPPRLNRHGQLEDRDSHRLRDKNGHPVHCFRCGTSALPETVAAAAPSTKRARKATAKAAQYEMWKNIISCDYCNLHWHLDCLDPPLLTMPTFSKKWMCPNHSEQTLHPKRRMPKQNTAPIEITKPKQFNNGNIDIINSESPSNVQRIPKLAVDEVLINGRRYRVPERVILLDFWNKISKSKQESSVREQLGPHSGESSPLTSLSSLDESDEPELPSQAHGDPNHRTTEDLKVAQMLCSLQGGLTAEFSSQSFTRLIDVAVQTEQTPLPPSAVAMSSSGARLVSSVKRPSNALQQAIPPSISIPTPSSSSSALKRKRASPAKPPAKQGSRELRTRNSSSRTSRVDDGSTEDVSQLTLPSAVKSKSRVKVEESDFDLSISNGSGSRTTATRPRSTGLRRRKSRTENGLEEEVTPKRGKKRKEPDDEAYVDRSGKGKQPRRSIGTREKSARTAGGGAPLSSATATSSLTSLDSPSTSASVPPSAAPPTTPLKIRLPRLNLINSPSQHHAGSSTGA